MNQRLTHSASGPASGRGTFLPAGASGFLGRALAVAAGGLILVAGLLVSAVVFSVLLAAGLVAGGWLWWKTRHLRKDLAERMAQMQRMQASRSGGGSPYGPSPGEAFDPFRSRPDGREGDVIDGDYIRDPERR